MSVFILRSSVQPSAAPAWFLSMTDKTWATPVTNTLDAVKPAGEFGSHSAICTAWSGFCVDQDRGEYIAAANGGHTDYGGNEVYAVAMRQASPAWVRLTDPSTLTGGTQGTNTKGDYGDGNMRSVHGWHRACFGNGRVWYPGMDGMYQNGAWSTACWSFDRTSLAWAYHGLAMASPGGNYVGEAGIGCFDSVGNRAYGTSGSGAGAGGIGLYSIDATTGSVSTHAVDHGRQPRSGGIAHDLRLMVLVNPYEDDIAVLDLTNIAAGVYYKTPSNSSLFPGDGAGCVYHAASRGFLFHDGYGATIRKLSIPADPVNGTWAWSEVTADGSNAVTPSSPPAAGTYSKFNIINDMGNGQSCLTLCNGTTEGVYVYKLPAGGV